VRFLLDTHAFLWLHGAPEKVPARLAKELASPSAELLLSVVSAQEIVVKHALGKLVLPETPRKFVESRCQAAAIELLPLLPAHIWELSALPLHHRDPFDRALIGQARVEGLTLVSADRAFASYDLALRW
jgi:PIN domain nuclease of toxin-antitoxin system